MEAGALEGNIAVDCSLRSAYVCIQSDAICTIFVFWAVSIDTGLRQAISGAMSVAQCQCRGPLHCMNCREAADGYHIDYEAWLSAILA